MIDRRRFALNRIAVPDLGMREFFSFAAGLGISKVELRNDIRDGSILDGQDPSELASMARDSGTHILSINALQKFNLPSARARALAELETMIGICATISCPAIVLCPNNDSGDTRSPEARLEDTVASLEAFAPLFEGAGIVGLVEPLGFGISSLASIVTAQRAIRGSGRSCYLVLVDTFHYFIGPDAPGTIGAEFDAPMTGLVHVSGVEEDIPVSSYLDENRILPGKADRMHSRDTMRALVDAGYAGDISFEPFSTRIQKMAPEKLASGLEASLAYLSE
jgi:2-keto-myo-inositol isomerase